MAEYRWIKDKLREVKDERGKTIGPSYRWLYTGEDQTIEIKEGEFRQFDGPVAEVIQCQDMHTDELLDSWVMTIIECNRSDEYYGEEPEYFDSEDEAKRIGEVKIGLTRDKGTGETLKWEPTK